MSRKICLLIALFAFLIQLQTGQELTVCDALGFAIVDREVEGVMEPVHVFFDAKRNLLIAIPSKYILVAVYLPEHGVM